VKQNAPRRSHKIKYLVLAVMLGLAAAGSVQIACSIHRLDLAWPGHVGRARSRQRGLRQYQGERHFQWGTLITIVFSARWRSTRIPALLLSLSLSTGRAYWAAVEVLPVRISRKRKL